MSDLVNHPPHYTSHPSGVECITVVEHMGFNLGNAIKYLWRADEKGNALEDLRKAAWYVQRELSKREHERGIACCGGCGAPIDPGAHPPMTPAFVSEGARCDTCADPAAHQREA